MFEERQTASPHPWASAATSGSPRYVRGTCVEFREIPSRMLNPTFRAFQLFIAFPYFPLEFKLVSALFTLILIDRHFGLPPFSQDFSAPAAGKYSPNLLLMLKY
jgi:hypothetical protein